MTVYRGCSLFMNNFQLSDSVEYTPPEISINTGWFKAGAMTTPNPVDRGIKQMRARYKMAGIDPTAFLFLGLVPGFRARLTVHRVFHWRGRPVLIHDEMEGFIENIRSDGHDDNKVDVGQEMSMAINYYRVSVDGVLPLLEIIPAQGIRRQFGVDPHQLSARMTELLR
ncbi:phage major tail tube protein [Klebsiella aerogenes]|uniref:phage major tail tube protein n=1 Tax=Klebsiella aerogenes TaxID=548 RepID=UPI002E30E2E6|nr:phage major tail tube protein [Klebsiella aerogenes]MED7790450.1 phage major tail tube protein [Klebsiella aerogenes]